MNSSALRIGEVALRAGVSIDTVRYYERRQLLPAAARTDGGFRLFTPDAVERVWFIKQAQELGFSLDEIGELLTTGGAEKCRRVRASPAPDPRPRVRVDAARLGYMPPPRDGQVERADEHPCPLCHLTH